MLKKLPFILVLSRIPIALIIFLIAYVKPESFQLFIVILMIVGLLTDVFDGIIARKIGVSSERLRVWDSNVDLFFWLLVIFSVFLMNFEFVLKNIHWILGVVFLELFAYIISFVKFKKSIATHSIQAKIWTLTLLWFLIDLTIKGDSIIAFYSCIILGLISRLEIILIILFLKKWTSDIPSLLVVGKLNRGEEIKKNKLFNG